MQDKRRFEVVISGMSGAFPSCNSVEEFKEKLFSKESLLRDDWEVVEQSGLKNGFSNGKIPQWKAFDCNFFGMSSKLIKNFDPIQGNMLEKSFEAMVDAGVNPYSLNGRNISVLTALSNSDGEILHFKIFNKNHDGYGMVGQSRAMKANRLSYHFNFTGPSLTYDGSFVAGLQALETAADQVAQGAVEAAVVVTSNIIMTPSNDKEYEDIKLLSSSGKCSPYDADAKGFCRSEGSVAFFIQREVDAKRKYCSLLQTKVRFLGDRQSGILRVDSSLENLLRSFYEEGEIDPKEISYIEAAGYCLKDTDTKELNAIAQVFRKPDPILMGAVSGNIGNTEGTSGFVSLVKVIIAMESGTIPPTINYHTPNPEVEALTKGLMQPVTESLPVPGDLMAVNCLSLSGSAGHVVVKRSSRSKTETVMDGDDLPRLVILQARHEEGIKKIIEKIHSQPVNHEYAAMVNDLFLTQVPSYLWKGFTFMSTSDKAFDYKMHDSIKRPVWFVFSGMGSQWPGMGRDLLRIPLFAAAIDRCDRVLRPKGLDIKHILTTDKVDIFNNILNCFVGIAAVQIGLVDILTALGVTPDGMVGHSVGEQGCGYADGCLTAEQMILAAYARGRASLECKTTPGMMAAVGRGYSAMRDQIPQSLDVACHNSSDSCTLSGPTEDVLQYVKQLEDSGVFAKAVSTGDIAYHSRYIKPIATKLMGYLKEIIPDPKPRSRRWVCSSVPEGKWNTRDCGMCSAEYNTNNLLSPVLFEEACKHIPENAIVIEIAPRGLLQAILRRSLPSDCLIVALTSRTFQSNVKYLLKSVGQLYLHGVAVDLNALYPPVTYPVSRGTPSLADIVTWDHSTEHYQEYLKSVVQFEQERFTDESYYILLDKDYDLLSDHRIGGQVILPLSHMLMIGWKRMKQGFGQSSDNDMNLVVEDSIVTDDVKVVPSETILSLSMSPVSTRFELYSEKSERAILSGSMRGIEQEVIKLSPKVKQTGEVTKVTGRDLYRHLGRMGCDVGKQWRTIVRVMIGETACTGYIKWTGSTTILLESIFKILIFLKSEEADHLMRISSFKRLALNVKRLSKLRVGAEIEVHYDFRCDRLVCKAVELIGVTLSPTTVQAPPLEWTEQQLVPYCGIIDTLEEFLSTCIQLVVNCALSNWRGLMNQLDIIIVNGNKSSLQNFNDVLNSAAAQNKNINCFIKSQFISEAKAFIGGSANKNVLIVCEQEDVTELASTASKNINVFYLTHFKDCKRNIPMVKPVLFHQSPKLPPIVLLKAPCKESHVAEYWARGLDADWLVSLRHLMTSHTSGHVVVISTQSPCQLLPVIAREHYVSRLRLIFLMENTSLKMGDNSSLLSKQLALGLHINILYNSEWCFLSRIHLQLEFEHRNFILPKSDRGDVQVRCVGLNTTTVDADWTTEVPLKYVDYSGLVGGQPVMGVGQLEPFTNDLKTDLTLRWSVPDGWTMEEAATVPVVYCLAYYCLFLQARLQPGQVVLITAATTPVGLALIRVALHVGGKVVACVDTVDQGKNLINTISSINPKDIIVLERESLKVGLMKRTNGKGARVIVNGQRGHILKDCIKVMALDCVFLYLGEIKVEHGEAIGMNAFMKRTVFRAITLDSIERCSHEWKQKLQQFVRTGLEQNIVKPMDKKVFPQHNRKGGISFLKHGKKEMKTVTLMDAVRSSDMTVFQPYHINIVTGSQSDLVVDVVEWLARQGCRRLVVLVGDEGLDWERVDSVVHHYNCLVLFIPLAKAETLEGAKALMEELHCMAPVQHVFCLQTEANNKRLENLELASREVLPDLDQWVSLLGDDISVCQARAAFGLSVCCVRGEGHLENPALILSYLTSLLRDSKGKRRFVTVNEKALVNIEKTEEKVETVFPSFVLNHLYRQECELKEVPQFVEQPTRSPGHQYTQYNLLPVFVLPGIQPSNLHSLMSRLIHPAFVCSSQARMVPVDQYAKLICQEIYKIQSHGQFILLGDMWSSAVALEVGYILEDGGHQVQLFLLEGGPSMAQDTLTDLCGRHNTDLTTCVIVEVLKLPAEKAKVLSKLPELEKKINDGLICSQVPVDERTMVGRALSSVCSQLTSLQQYRPPDRTLRGDLKVISHRELTASEISDLKKICKMPPEIFMTHDKSYEDLLKNNSTLSFIHEKISFDWTL